jgi:hypothetical protein
MASRSFELFQLGHSVAAKSNCERSTVRRHALMECDAISKRWAVSLAFASSATVLLFCNQRVLAPAAHAKENRTIRTALDLRRLVEIGRNTQREDFTVVKETVLLSASCFVAIVSSTARVESTSWPWCHAWTEGAVNVAADHDHGW